MRTNKKMFLIVFIILTTMLACTIFIGGPDYPNNRIPISTEAVGDLQTSIAHSLSEGENTGIVSLEVTEEQITSYLFMKLLLQPDPFLTDPQVYLRDGQIQVFGTAHQGYFQATGAIIMSAKVDNDGKMIIDIVSADFGSISLPAGLADLVASIVDEAFTGSLGPVATGIRLTDISIVDGVMTIVGTIK